mmetsp:Transcript_19760/g.48550  ORF Transcript_19760/g.48550 Transcript_19760/m.48550 type:complete len:225 (+) Transcript_19760:378-1052(+)
MAVMIRPNIAVTKPPTKTGLRVFHLSLVRLATIIMAALEKVKAELILAIWNLERDCRFAQINTKPQARDVIKFVIRPATNKTAVLGLYQQVRRRTLPKEDGRAIGVASNSDEAALDVFCDDEDRATISYSDPCFRILFGVIAGFSSCSSSSTKTSSSSSMKSSLLSDASSGFICSSWVAEDSEPVSNNTNCVVSFIPSVEMTKPPIEHARTRRNESCIDIAAVT